MVLTSGCEKTPAQVADELVAKVRGEIGAVASFRQAAVVSALPKTRSGKTLRGLIQSIADGKAYKVPGTMEAHVTHVTCVSCHHMDVLHLLVPGAGDDRGRGADRRRHVGALHAGLPEGKVYVRES